MLSRLLEKLRSKWHALRLPYRVYVVASALALVGTAEVFFPRITPKVFEFSITGSAFMFGVGFFLWIKPWLINSWQTSHGKLLLAALHTAILFVAVIPSREFVSVALGLPPQDFEITVHFFAIELYPALWFFLLSFAALGVSVIFLLLAMLCMLSTSPVFNDLLLLASKLLQPQSKVRSFIESGRDQFMSKTFGHVMGAIFVSLAAAYVWDLHRNFLTTNPQIIRSVAFFTDFHYSANYPGVDSKRRLRVHENGVVSYAERDGYDVKITVERLHD